MPERFFRTAATLDSTTTTVLQVGAQEQLILTAINACTRTNNSAQVTLKAKIGSNTYTLVREVLVDSSEPLGLLTGRLVLDSGDELQASSTAALDLWVSGVIST